MFLSIRTKLILSHFTLILLGTLAFGAAGYLLLQKGLESAATEKLQVLTFMAARETEGFLQGKQQMLLRISEGREVQDFPVNYRVPALSSYLAKFKDEFSVLSYLNAEEEVDVAVLKGDVARVPQIDPDLSLSHLARQQPGLVHVGQVSYGEYGDDLSGSTIPMVLGIHEYFGDKYVGMLRGEVPLAGLTARLKEIPVGRSGHVLLIDGEGTVLMVSHAGSILSEEEEDVQVLSAQLAGFKTGSGRTVLRGRDFLAARTPVDMNGWSVIALLPYEEFILGPNRLRSQYLLIFLVVGSIGALLAFLLSNRITGPLLKMAAGARAVARGKLEPIAKARTRDEIGQLIESFNSMILDLQATTVSRDQLDNIFGSMHDAIFVVGSDGRVRMVNRASCDLLGLPMEVIVGQTYDDLFGCSLDDYHSFSALRQLEDQDCFETLLFDADRRKIPVAISVGAMRDAEGAPHEIVCLVQDITERKTAEEKIRNSRNFLETVLNSIGDAISIIDVETFAIIGTNRVFLERCGLSESEVLGKKCYDLSSHDCQGHNLTPEICPVLRTVASGESASGEHQHHDSAGNRAFVEVKTSPLKNSGGELSHVVHVARDISERKRTEIELQLFAKKLELSNRELTDFAYVASHDLQEPLRKVTAFGDRLKSKYQDVLGEQGLDYLERMRHAAVRMQTLIEDLLSFSRVSTQAQPFSPVEMSEIIGEVLDDLEIRIQELKGTIEVGNLPAIEADPLQMRQIMQNLLGNALKFHRPGVAPLIRVQGELVDGGKNCRITVADNGIGFEEKYLERIFGVFQRLHGRNEYAGSGVGLAICRKITERHHGSVTAMSRAGEGATFILTLPVSQKEKRSAP
ncbi:hypothetical protein DSOUD_1995 [Desulfuromonas soudanensis]|uniref:histidine kinase n=1 Tax=Desulfuromonas soudanensis TaxID=1603606 RepID=A0A0M3QFW2_9BACT|nr:PAS domain S-box protein [Desulfuromonas soudanensis]ALC16763.1 hypothetical protein DSOUD_1995 [Desulfuromonas soudanensis]